MVKKRQNPSYFWLRVVLGIVIFVEVILGVGAIFVGGDAESLAEIYYGTSLNLDAQSIYVIKILGAYMLSIAFLAMLAWRNPARNKYIFNGLILLFAIRALERVVFMNEIRGAFDISLTRLIFGAGVYFALAGLLFLLKPKGDENE